MPTNKIQWFAIIIGLVAFLAIINNLNGAADREAEAAQVVRDSLRLIVIADSTLRVRDREDFEERLAFANEGALDALREREEARLDARTARAERDGLAARVNALPDSVTVVPRPVFDSVVVASREAEAALESVVETLVADTVRLSDLLAGARAGWDGEIESHGLTRMENAANRSLAEAWERAANPGFLSKLWDGKEEFLVGALLGGILVASLGN